MFVLLATHLIDDAARTGLLARHHEFLEQQYRAGRFLASGPAVSRPGGVILTRGSDEAELRNALRQDPFVAGGIVEYEIIGFRATRAADPDLLDGA